ncbi:MAG: SPASM domain-containing protein [Armatimonadetes bacterium]|nr:SPASM domain-containing protein [Armatimonadota bacterium]
MPPLAPDGRDLNWVLPPEDYGELLVTLLDAYLERLDRIRIPSLDGLCRSVSSRQGSVCTFGDCLGGYLAVGPDGGIYPCQRFVGLDAYCLGNVAEQPGWDELAATPVWQAFRAREERVREECGDCPHFDYCRGGCPYDALAAGGGVFRELRDPYCPAYRRIFDHITDRALDEVFSDENLDAVVEEPNGEGLLRRGKLLGLMRGDPHPTEAKQHARQLLLAVALGANQPRDVTAERLVQAGVARSAEAAAGALERLAKRLRAPVGRNNLYLHVTFGCNLTCDHCYAEAGPARVGGPALSAEQVLSLCRQAAALGFRQAVITGGEPLVHPEREALLDGLAALRAEVKPLLTVLRTNLAIPMGSELLARIAGAVDKVFVSLDGGEAEHDARRGAGSHARTVGNLRALLDASGHAEVALTAIMSEEDAAGPRGGAVRGLARELGIRRVHFRPLLPLGRAGDAAAELVPEAHWAYLGAEEAAAYGMSPAASCGLGQNLYVEPTGDAFPCYAWCGAEWRLGNVWGADGLAAVVESAGFRDLATHTVDINLRCRECAVRYLCGGVCRAWAGAANADLDAPVACGALHERAVQLARAALDRVGLTAERWEEAGLPPLNTPAEQAPPWPSPSPSSPPSPPSPPNTPPSSPALT